LSETELELNVETPVEPEAPPFRDPDPQEVARRKRGRPRKQVAEAIAAGPEEAPEPPLDVPMPPRSEDTKEPPKSAPSPSQAWKLDAEVIGLAVAGVFGCIAVTTRHDHWHRTPEQCKPISDPLQRLYAKLPAAKRKKLLDILDPGVLLTGIYQVAGPSIAVEMELAQARRQGLILQAPARGARPTAPGAAPSPPPAPSEPADPGKIGDLTGVFVGAVN